jgi:hypothetical protein
MLSVMQVGSRCFGGKHANVQHLIALGYCYSIVMEQKTHY